MGKKKSRFLSGKRIDPAPIDSRTALADLIDESFMAYNAARLREACQLYTRKMLEPDVTIGVTLTGALTPAGLGISAIIPLIKAGFIDWIISTGANLYHTYVGLVALFSAVAGFTYAAWIDGASLLTLALYLAAFIASMAVLLSRSGRRTSSLKGV